MPWYCYLAFKQLFPTGKKFSFFSIMAIIGVMLGVMVLLVVQTIMNGFGYKINEKLRDTMGDIKLTSSDVGIIYDWRPLLKNVEAKKYVAAVAPYANGPFMIQHQDRPAFPFVRGIDIDLEPKVLPLKRYIKEGQLEDLDDQTVILSRGLARTIGARMGSMIDVYTPLMLDKMKQEEILLPKELEVVGIYETGWSQADEGTMLISLRLMQELYNLGPGIHGMTIKIKDGFDPQVAATDINLTLGNKKVHAQSWLEAEQDFMFILKLEKTMMFFIVLFVILVASFSIASSLMTTVVRKTREIGLLGALGAQGRHIAYLYSFQGFLIGITGTILGLVFGALAIGYRNNIVHTLAKLVHREDVVQQYFQFTDIPAHYELSNIVAIVVSTVIITTIAGFIPAMRAATLKPSEALRNE